MHAAEGFAANALSSLDSQLAEVDDVLSYSSDILSTGGISKKRREGGRGICVVDFVSGREGQWIYLWMFLLSPVVFRMLLFTLFRPPLPGAPAGPEPLGGHRGAPPPRPLARPAAGRQRPPAPLQEEEEGTVWIRNEGRGRRRSGWGDDARRPFAGGVFFRCRS